MFLKTFFFLLVSFSVFGAEWDIVYLASFPRSGNHWMRYLIEEASHVATSSVYRDQDYFHLPTRFPWGGYSTRHGYEGNCRYPKRRDPVVVKTHYPFYPETLRYPERRTICMIRHPLDSFYSFYCYARAGQEIQNQIPRELLIQYIEGWKKVYSYWRTQKSVLFIRYEDLYCDPFSVLKQVMEMIGYPVQDQDIHRAVDHYPPSGTLFKSGSHFSEDDLRLIRDELSGLLLEFDYEI